MTNLIACLILVSCVTANLGTLGFTPTPSGRNCGLPGKIENGYLAVPDHSYGSVANYYCSTGYKLVGNSQITCTENGWSASAPRCERVRPINPMPEPKLTDEEGLTVMLPCIFSVSSGTVDLTHLVVKWEFQGNPMVTFIDNQLTSSRKAWLFQDELRKGNASLLLTNVSSADKGNYTCVIQYFSEVIRKMTASLNIDDVSPPSTKPGSKEDDQARPTILLPCYFTVDSGTVDLNHLKVQWQFKGNHAAKFVFNTLFNSKKAHLSLEELRKGNASLVVINASSADTGDYTCDVSYKSDSIPRVTVILSIQVQPLQPASVVLVNADKSWEYFKAVNLQPVPVSEKDKALTMSKAKRVQRKAQVLASTGREDGSAHHEATRGKIECLPLLSLPAHSPVKSD
ncbi:uncharacterized protein LOC122805778 [Protopterus annectens]|uniref:uncharacterized protein LOC122805778 n=1 Tax=Protopterus annectens TaxID=7888 RepID=UPI001CF932CC|nr:uncharacterized protein LOC122805778 [Protopterus annectens]